MSSYGGVLRHVISVRGNRHVYHDIGTKIFLDNAVGGTWLYERKSYLIQETLIYSHILESIRRKAINMKTYKQAKIPKGTVEVRFRGSSEENGSFSAKLIVPMSKSAEALAFLGQFRQKIKRKSLSLKN